MARYKNGINGPVNGKVGTVVGVTWRGIEVLRSAPVATKRPTKGQLQHRKTFGMVSSWLKPLRELIWIGYQSFTAGKTPMNEAISFVFKEALTGTADAARIDFPRVVFSRGELFISIVKEVSGLAGQVLHLKWESASVSAFNSPDDWLTLIWYNPAKEKFVTFKEVAKRGDHEVQLQLPRNFSGNVVHGYMQYVNVGGNAVSTTLYLGTVQVV